VLLDWLVIERIFNDRSFFENEFDQIPDQQKLRICFNILPVQKSITHRIAQDQTLSDPSVIMKALFEVCKNPVIEDINPPHQMPFFEDSDGNNPFDYVLQIHNRSVKDIEQKVKLGSFNKNLAEELFI